MPIHAFAAPAAGARLEPFQYEPLPLAPDEVEIIVETCGICHSDLSMLDNEWGFTSYPFVGGHEVVGKVALMGDAVRNLSVGQRVGLGWYSHSCQSCAQCVAGDQNLCPTAEATIVGRHGGFADRLRAHADWLFPLPEALDARSAGPLFCGGITVFNPIVQLGIRATDRVGVVGIGGLGHMAIMFLRAWGCEVTAFSTSPDKEAEARELGAHHFVATRDPEALARVANTFDMILVTVNADLDWNAYVAALRPRGRLHLVGAAAAVNVAVFPLILGQKSISASPLGSPATVAKMLDFAARQSIAPVTEYFPMSRINDALDRLRSGKARYRIVLENDRTAN